MKNLETLLIELEKGIEARHISLLYRDDYMQNDEGEMENAMDEIIDTETAKIAIILAKISSKSGITVKNARTLTVYAGDVVYNTTDYEYSGTHYLIEIAPDVYYDNNEMVLKEVKEIKEVKDVLVYKRDNRTYVNVFKNFYF